MPFSILLLTLSSFPLHLGQIASLLKNSNLFRHARVWQRMSRRLNRIFPINISAEMFLHMKAESWEAQSSPFCCLGKGSAQRRAGEVVWEETVSFTQRNPPLLPLQDGGQPPREQRGLAPPPKHLPLAHPRFSNQNTQECKKDELTRVRASLCFTSHPLLHFLHISSP